MNTDLYGLDPLLLGLLLAALLVCSAFFAAAETAILSINWMRLRYLVRKGTRNARALEHLLTRKDRMLGTILVGNNAVNIAASAIATALGLAYFGESGIAIATGAMTFVLLILGEISPKTFASRHSERVALALAPVLGLIQRLLTPVVFLITGLSNGLLRLFGVQAGVSARPSLSEEELRLLLAEGTDTAAVAEGKRRMLHGIFRLTRQTAREVMVPRPRVNSIDIATDIEEAARSFVSTGYTRLPVYRGSLDNIVGVVHARDALDMVMNRRAGGLSAILREIFFVPEAMTLEQLLAEFQRKQVHLAAVVDEYGGVEGIVTLEDVLEEIVGEIRDEHDVEIDAVRFLPSGEALVRGTASVREVNQALGLALPTDVDSTVGGFIMTTLGHIPEIGDSFFFHGARFTVERAAQRRVLLVRVIPLPPSAPDSPSPEA